MRMLRGCLRCFAIGVSSLKKGSTGSSQRKNTITGDTIAGLFAPWAAYQTDTFKGVAAVSPSVWFPDFENYVFQNRIQTEAVYLSLGDKEEKTRNPVMTQVGNAIRSIHRHLDDSHIYCAL